jgi:hypothetical protein
MRRTMATALAVGILVALLPAANAPAAPYKQLAHEYSRGGANFGTGPWVSYLPYVDIVAYCRDGDDPPGLTERRAAYIWITKEKWFSGGQSGNSYKLPCDGRRRVLNRAAVLRHTTYRLFAHVVDRAGFDAASEAYVDVFGQGRAGY